MFSSCGCTSVSLTKNELRLGRKPKLVCLFNSRAFDGFKQATVTVRFDQPYVGEVQLTVRGNIVTAVNVQPESINFGQVSPTRSPERVTMLQHVGSPSFRVVDVKSTFPHVGVKLRETKRAGNQVVYEMRTRLKDTAPTGFTQGELYVVVEENGRRSEVPVKFNAKVGSLIKVSPEVLTMTGVSPGKTVTKKVIVRADEAVYDYGRQMPTTFVLGSGRESGVQKRRISWKSVTPVPTRRESSECELSFYTDLSGDEASGKIKAIVEVTADEDGNVELSDRRPNGCVRAINCRDQFLPHTTLVFVYGTLKRSGCRNRVLVDQEFVDDADTLSEYALYDLGAYPGLDRVAGGWRCHIGRDLSSRRSLSEPIWTTSKRLTRASIAATLSIFNRPTTPLAVQAWFYERATATRCDREFPIGHD